MDWTPLTGASDVDPGQVQRCSAGDAELVVWRTVGGRLCAADRRCPHQWSDLADEGVVDGEELVCRAHGWRFDTDGHGSKVNVKGRRDRKGDLSVVPVREHDGRLEVGFGVPG